MNNQNKIFTIVNSKYYPLLLFFLSFVFVTLFSRSTSFLYVYEGFDAAIFKQMGLAVLRGKTLYLDYFDNKGCILYFIQALGLCLGGNFFILLMQTISLTITLVFWDKTIAFYQEGRSRFLCLGIALFLMLCFYDGGDLSEEWCLPFASYPIYLYFRYLNTNKEIKKNEMFIIGVCFGIIAFIRINNATAFLGFLFYLFFNCLKNKNYKKFVADALLFILGFTLISGLCILYFYIKAESRGVYEMIYGTFLSYFEYFDYNISQTIFHYIFYILFIIVSVSIICINIPRQKVILIPTLLSYALFICSSGTRCFTHYLMATLPLIVVCLLSIDFKTHRKINYILTIIAIIPIISFLIRPIGFFFNDLVLDKEPFKNSYNEFHRCIEEIPETYHDSIYNYNLSGIGAGMMQHEGLLQCNRVLFSPFALQLPTLFKEEISKPFIWPKWILISGDKTFNVNDVAFILENYDLKYYFDHNTKYVKGLNMGELTTVCFYCRKD
jgi:hypothetical protein